MKRTRRKGSAGLGLAAAVATTICGAGCAGVPFRCPAQGGPAWRELTSPHFTLSTDLDVDDAAVALRDLEEYRAALLATAWPTDSEPGGRLRVVILARERDWRQFEGEHSGFFTETLFQPLIALRAGATDQTRTTIRHELTHHLSSFYVRRQPRWLSEGLATFFETVAYDRDGGEVLIGLPQPSRLAKLRGGDLSVPKTLTGALEHEANESFYATSWLLVHYFISRERPSFTRYMHALNRGDDDAQAWRAGFGDLRPQTLQGELRTYWGEGRPLVAIRAFRAPTFTFTQRRLDDATVHALRALLHLRGMNQAGAAGARDRARAEVDEALAADRLNVLALAIRAWALELPVDLATARAAAVSQPDSWLAHAVIYRAVGGDLSTAEGRRAAATALRLTSANPAIKPPFGPGRSLFASSPSSSPPSSRAVCRSTAGVPACAADRSSRDDDLDYLRAIAASDVGWCFFEHPASPMLAATLDLDAQGRPTSVCISAASSTDPIKACVQNVMADLQFPASPACPRRRTFELALTPDGRITVFGSERR